MHNEGFAFRYAPFQSVFHWYIENDLSGLIVKLNHLNPFHAVYKLYVCLNIFNGCYFIWMFSGIEQTSLRKMLRDKEFKEGEKILRCLLALIKGCACHIVESGKMEVRH